MGLIALERMREADISVMLFVERGLDVLGDEGKETTLHYLETNGLGRDEIPHRMRTFVTGLRYIYGSSSCLIESEIEGGLRLMENLSPQPCGLTGAVNELTERETGTR